MFGTFSQHFSSEAYFCFWLAILPMAVRWLYSRLSSDSICASCSPTPIICSRISAFSLFDAFMNLGRSSASADRKEFSSCCPDLLPLGSMTFRLLFLPFRSTIRPFDSSTWRIGSVYAPSLAAAVGLYLSPPSAHAMASSTEVFPWLLLPPMMVRPFADGSSFTALIRLTFSISRLLIFTLMLLPPHTVQCGHRQTGSFRPVPAFWYVRFQ